MPTIDDPRLFRPQCASLLPVQTVHKNPWFTVRNRGGYYTIEYNMPQVLILPVVEDKWLVLARVYRPVICDATWELPAGGADANESPVEAARRELSEETGIQIVDLNRFQIRPPLVHMPRSPYLPFIFTVLLTEQEFEERGIYDSEVQEAGRFAFSEVLEKIVAGEIYVGLHIAVMMKFLLCHGTEALRKWQLSCIPAR